MTHSTDIFHKKRSKKVSTLFQQKKNKIKKKKKHIFTKLRKMSFSVKPITL